jgi:hypothetical protein
MTQLFYFDGFEFTIHSAVHWLEGMVATDFLLTSAANLT